MNTKRGIIKALLDGQPIPYVPWQCGFTKEALARLQAHLGKVDWEDAVDNHILKLGHSTGFFESIGNDRYRDEFGVVWDRSIEKDIGNVEGLVLPEPTLNGYTFPDSEDNRYFENIPGQLEARGDCFRMYCIGFSLFERAWTLRGMDNILIDFYENPDFVHALLDAIADYNIARIKKALTYDIDAVYFGDDWGQQSGLIMGPDLWREFIRPRVARMYRVARNAGKYQVIHSCGDIRLLIDDLIELGVNMINPFQPEAMDVEDLLTRYRGRVTFYGGLSTQRTLPYGTVEQVQAESRRLLELGAHGGLLFSPAHAVEGDTPIENMLAFLNELRAQPGYCARHADKDL